jgi:hypothetical protein
LARDTDPVESDDPFVVGIHPSDEPFFSRWINGVVWL